MATVRTKKQFTSRSNDVDRLANKFGSNLKITDVADSGTRARKGTRSVQASKAYKTTASPEESKSAAMRNINNVLQTLSSLAGGTSRSTASSSATTGRAALSVLRKLNPELLDTERAALNMAGKLLALDVHDAALDVLENVRQHLPSFYSHGEINSASRLPLSLLQLPLPLTSLDPSIQSCILTYLTHTISVVTPLVATKANLFDTFCDVIDGPTSLQLWVPFLTALPHRSLDALFKRAYVVLTASLASPPIPPLHILKIRFHALRILLLSTELDVTPFWEQCLKYAASYARNSEATEEENAKITVLLTCFSNIEKAAEARREGKGWVAFCEYWMALAKRAGDMQTLNVVATYIRNAASSSKDGTQLATQSCTSLTQLAAFLDQADGNNSQLDSTAEAAASGLRSIHASLSNGILLDSKLRRAAEKCRKACLTALPRFQPNSPERKAVVGILEEIVTFLEHIVNVSVGATSERQDATISSLDTLFQLSTAVFSPQRAETCDQAYDYLMRAQRLVERSSSTAAGKLAVANYTRCLAGAFANVAGTLYKAGRQGIAIRFLMQACPLSEKASEVFGDSRKDAEASEPDEKERETWKAHRTQVYRRWELLGVCYVKTEDRRPAFDAFVQGVISYPFEDEFPPSANANVSTKLHVPDVLFNAIDRLTHLATTELHLSPKEVSLRDALRARKVAPALIGVILTRQVYVLSERTKPYVRKVLGLLHADILSVYDASHFPIRRTQAHLLVLEHMYYSTTENSSADSIGMAEIIQEIRQLLSEKARVGEDGKLVHLRSYLRAKMMLWAVLHTHRMPHAGEDLLTRIEAALGALDTLTAEREESAILIDVKGKIGGKGRNAAVSRTRSVSTRNAQPSQVRVPAVKTRVAHLEPVRRSPPASKATDNGTAKAAIDPYPGVAECLSLAGLMIMVAELLDLSGLVLMRVRLLVLVRKLLEKTEEPTSEAYLHASATLAHVLIKLGKTSIASGMLAPTVDELSDSIASSPSAVIVLLRYAEALAMGGDTTKSVAVYENASRLADNMLEDEIGKGPVVASRVRSRVVALERVALASTVYAAIQDAKDESASSLKALLQALRLLNRATDMLARLNPATKQESSPSELDPFAMSDVKNALSQSNEDMVRLTHEKAAKEKRAQPQSQLDGLEWRIANALIEVQLALAQSYAARGSAREAEYFIQQAGELARVLGTSAMMARALLQKSEIQLALGSSDEAQRSLSEAMELMKDGGNLDEVDVHRAVGDRLVLCSQEDDAQGEFDEASKMLAETKRTFDALDSLILSPVKTETEDAFAPVLQAKILRQQVWLLRDVLGDNYESLLEELFALPQLPYIEVHVNSLLGRLALYDLHERFRSDMSLSSLAESTTALPTGMSCEKSMLVTPSQDILDALDQADDHYASDLSRFADRDSVVNVRAAAVAAALVSTYRASLGISFEDSPAFASHLLDISSSITLRRELIDAISFKFPSIMDQDDMRWPSESPLSVKKPPQHRSKAFEAKGRGLFDNLSDDDEDANSDDADTLRKYWDYVLKRHKSEAFIQPENAESEIDSLPRNWMVIGISLTEDKTALLISRQRPKHGPMVFCVPLKGRREDDDDEHFTFEDAMTELKDIIQSSDEGTRQASKIKSDDREAKAAWWTSRKELDQRMKELVENIEFCWLGAFKTILSQPMRIPPDGTSVLRSRFDKVFKSILGSHEKKARKAKLKLETSLLELFATLPATCRDEELQDLVYFVLDLYHFHGLPIALAEVDIDVVVVDLRSALEEHHSRTRESIVPEPDAHTFLVLDKNVQAIPWESLPTLRGCSVSRVPSMAFITDRLAWARCQRGLSLEAEESEDEPIDRVTVDPSNGYYLLNPSGDLSGTEGRFKEWVNDLRKVGWEGIVGHAPSEQQFVNALSRKDLVVYFGHGGAEQYVRSHKIRHLQRCAATMLWGCSSGALRDMGEFDRTGTPYNYMLAGCPSLVANLWDVTDRDIDKFALSVFTKLRLEPGEVGQWKKGKRGAQDGKVSVVAAVAQSRDVCKLRYLTGAAVVVYGIPYYL